MNTQSIRKGWSSSIYGDRDKSSAACIRRIEVSHDPNESQTYRSCPARSIKLTTLAALLQTSSQASFSLLATVDPVVERSKLAAA